MPKMVENAKNSIKKHNMIRLKPGAGGEKDVMQIIAKMHKLWQPPTHHNTRLYLCIPPTREEMHALKLWNV